MAETSIKNHNDPRAVRTRKLLVEAFYELLHKQSYDSLTVQDIAAKATLNRATFYAHFEDKNALLNYSITESFREALAKREMKDSDVLAEQVKGIVQVVCLYLEMIYTQCDHKDPMDTFEALMESQIKVQLEGVILDLLLQFRSGEGKPTSGLTLAAIAASWATYGVVIHWARGTNRAPMTKLLQQVLPMIETLLKTGLQVGK